MNQPKQKSTANIPGALKRFRQQWDKVSDKPGIDRIAKAAAMSNNSVLDLTSPERSSRYDDLIRRLTTGGRPESNVRTWARLTMQLALVLAGGKVDNWVDAKEWGIGSEEYGRLLEEAKAKISRAEEQLSGTVLSEKVRLHIVPLVYLADEVKPRRGRQQSEWETTNGSFLGAFARLALRSVKPEYEFEYAPIESLRELNPFRGEGTSRALKVGVFGIVSRERDTFEHIPIPGWRYKFACIGPKLDPVERAATDRSVFSTRAGNLLYLSVEDSSPASFLQSMFGRSLPQKSLHCNYSSDDIAAAYAAELDEHRDSVPLLVIDEAMADEVAQCILNQHSSSVTWKPRVFVDLLRHIPEGPSVPICVQVHRDDTDIVRLLTRVVIDAHSRPGEMFSLGALSTARTYARALVWNLSQYKYDYEQGPGVLSQDSLLLRVHSYFRGVQSQQAVAVSPPYVPGFCRLWAFDHHAPPPEGFVHLLADELACRIMPSKPASDSQSTSAAHQKAVAAVLTLVLPPQWHSIIYGSWMETRFGQQSTARLPAPQDDWRDGPAETDQPSR